MPVAGPVAVHDNIRLLTDEATSSLVMKLFELLLLVVLNHVVRITSVQNVLVSDIMSLFKAGEFRGICCISLYDFYNYYYSVSL